MNITKNTSTNPVMLVILDGWGYREELDGNAIAAAKTPVFDHLWNTYPKTLIQTSGEAVGLPKQKMGNSEAGHLNIGTGRIVPQELTRISKAIERRDLLHNHALTQTYQTVRENGKKLHLIGLCSDGGVHSHIEHLFALLEMAKTWKISEVCLHVILDGRDTSATKGKFFVQWLQDYLDFCGVGRIVTLGGRYYAMDRDRHWERIERAYKVMTSDQDQEHCSAVEVIASAYANGFTDEFFPPTRIAPGKVESGDGCVFFNFRSDRARQLTRAFVDQNFTEFERQLIQPLHFTTFTQYDASLPVPSVFEPQHLSNSLGEVIARQGLKQLRIAETEKYAHVTYFFNGGSEDAFEEEERILIPSPKVSTYDLSPEMSASEITRNAMSALEKQIYSLIVINYANPDMVGHTGNMDATIQAISMVDGCLGKLLESINRVGGTLIITADHGNAEYMRDQNGDPWTAHTINPVPLMIVESKKSKNWEQKTELILNSTSCLADIAPTILEILKLPQPSEMLGQSLLKPMEESLSEQPILVGNVV